MLNKSPKKFFSLNTEPLNVVLYRVPTQIIEGTLDIYREIYPFILAERNIHIIGSRKQLKKDLS